MAHSAHGGGKKEKRAAGKDLLFWLILADRGLGKTVTGVHWVIQRTRRGPFFPIALIGQTKADVRDTMAEVSEGSILRNTRGRRIHSFRRKPRPTSNAGPETMPEAPRRTRDASPI